MLIYQDQGRLSPFKARLFGFSDKAARLIAGPLNSLAIIPAN